ncbi:MAG: hypothetical protein JWO31_644 [Phycisphaerales bacterium]|nr:hypothetical protein [Phycisphaerales bacterium]
MKNLLSSTGIATLLAAVAAAGPARAEMATVAATPATRPAAVAAPVAAAKAAVKAVANKFEKDIAAFEAADRKAPPAPGGVLFYGSSSVRLWKTLTDDYAGYPVLNRGFGGSMAADAVLYVERVVVPARPSTIVFYEGDNDLNAGRKPEQILADYQTFAKLVHAKLPDTKILYVSIKPSPKRLDQLPLQRKMNEMTAAWIAKLKDQRLAFADVFTPMLDANGRPRGELFGPDMLHMNRDGYKLWTSVIGLKPAVVVVKTAANAAAAAVLPPSKPSSAKAEPSRPTN